MKNNLTCELVEDLLPSYIDGLTSEVTNSAVREHIAHCDKCKAELENMKVSCSETKIEEEKKEIDFLKKTRRKNIRTVVLSIVAVVLTVAVAICTLPYMGEERLFANEIYYDLDVEGNTFKVTATAIDSQTAISNIITEEEGLGVISLNVRGKKRSLFNARKNFSWEYTSENVKQLKIFDKIIWEDGEYISDITSAVYAEKHPYMGDMSANSDTAMALGVYDYIGNHTNALQSSKEPYEWKIIVTNELMPVQVKEKEALMTKYAYVLLGVINNLGEVEFEYEVYSADGDDKECNLKVTRQQASEFFGDDIGKCFNDINALQSLMEKTGLADMPYVQQNDNQSGVAGVYEEVYLKLFNKSDEDIQSIFVRCVETDRSVGHGIERELINFGRTKLQPKGYNFPLDTLSSNLYSEERMGKITFEITVKDFDGNEYILDEKIQVSASFGAVYHFVLDGNFRDGFTVKMK